MQNLPASGRSEPLGNSRNRIRKLRQALKIMSPNKVRANDKFRIATSFSKKMANIQPKPHPHLEPEPTKIGRTPVRAIVGIAEEEGIAETTISGEVGDR
ncbi:MAG TPA: hypothetical protein VLA12_18770 [Planctomycetaceae bacterium]|nr:hypothetical protein [Planctomycetaceae bacterium]